MDFDWKWGFGLEMEGLVHPNSVFGLVQPCRVFFYEKTCLSLKIMIFDDFQMIFHQNGPDLQLNRRTINETGVLDPMEF